MRLRTRHAIFVSAMLLTSGIAVSQERSEELYSAYADELNALIDASDQRTTRVPQEEVERHLESLVLAMRGPGPVDSSDAELLLRASLDAASVAPDYVEKIPDFVRMSGVAESERHADSDPERPKHLSPAALLDRSMWRLINAREFDRARGLAQASKTEFPKTFEGWIPPEDSDLPMYLAFEGDGSAMRPAARAVDFDHGSWLIVEVHPNCGPSRSAMNYLSSHPDAFGEAAKDRVLFVVSQAQGQSLPSLLEWNRNNPSTGMVLSYQNEDWPKAITFLQTPVFNFVQDGKVVDKVVGWPGDEQAEEVRKRVSTVFGE